MVGPNVEDNDQSLSAGEAGLDTIVIGAPDGFQHALPPLLTPEAAA